MPKHHDTAKESLSVRAQRVLNAISPALYHFAVRGSEEYLFDGLSIRRQGADWLCVARATALPSLRAVVCFGAGADLLTALRNLGLAIGKGQWRNDKFQKQ